MENFRFLSPTEIIFGKGTQGSVGEETKKYGKKALLHYGGGSIKKSGLYKEITDSLYAAGVEFLELGGVQPNPRLELVYEGIKLCRENNVDIILAVGGGSVMDSAKAMAMGVPYDGDVWDFYSYKVAPKATLPVGAVVTIAASGSEASNSSVIVKDKVKRPLGTNVCRPVFAIMNPEFTYTVSKYQTACGAADIISHAIERYFTNARSVELTDRFCESVMKTVISNAPKALENPDDYDARAELLWAGTLAHNDIVGTGRISDFASHLIEHELSAFNDVAHGAGLAIILPAWMKYVMKHDIERFVQYAVRVWNVEQRFYDPERTALEGIERMTEFFKSMGLPTTLGEIGISENEIAEFAARTRKPDGTAGNFVKLKEEDILEILKLAL